MRTAPGMLPQWQLQAHAGDLHAVSTRPATRPEAPDIMWEI